MMMTFPTEWKNISHVPVTTNQQKKVSISHRNGQDPYQAPEAAIRSAWEEVYADLSPKANDYILEESPLQKHSLLKNMNHHARKITRCSFQWFAETKPPLKAPNFRYFKAGGSSPGSL